MKEKETLHYTAFPAFIILPKSLAFSMNGMKLAQVGVELRYMAAAGIYRCSGGTGSSNEWDSVEYSPINGKDRSWNFSVKNYLKLKEDKHIIELFTKDKETVMGLCYILGLDDPWKN